MKPYYQDEWVTQYCSDALTVLSELGNNSIDLLCTDPPYGIGFMGKDWDKALPDKKIWAECLRVLKPGAFGFVMSIPRADCLARVIIAIQDVGFRVDFTPIYWAYASGFPKAQNIGKAVDKRLGIEPLERVEASGVGFMTKAEGHGGRAYMRTDGGQNETKVRIIMPERTTSQAKALDGSYGGFQPKPAVEVIIVAMKPLSEKTFVDQALKNRKGITWLDDCRIPYESEEVDFTKVQDGRIYGDGNCIGKGEQKETTPLFKQSGRFPANLLVSDDVLNDGRGRKSGKMAAGITRQNRSGYSCPMPEETNSETIGDSGSFSRYFDLDKWAQKIFPFLIVPKANKSEKNKGLGDITPQQVTDGRSIPPDYPSQRGQTVRHNIHPTCKPLKLMSYLITLGSRPGDTVLDPFGGSGTTALASKLLGRKCIISEIEEKYCEIAAKRCCQSVMELKV